MWLSYLSGIEQPFESVCKKTFSAESIPSKRGMAMKHYSMKIDGDPVRFTPDGKIAVVDAIKALSAGRSARRIWESLKSQRPEFKDLCQGYNFTGDQTDSVVDGEGWEEIENALLDYILDHRSSG